MIGRDGPVSIDRAGVSHFYYPMVYTAIDVRRVFIDIYKIVMPCHSRIYSFSRGGSGISILGPDAQNFSFPSIF